MSLSKQTIQKIEVWLIIIFSVVTISIYARNQLLYSLYFFYQLGRFFFPGVVPEIDPSSLL
jgi:hypothetical protein